MLLTLSTTHRPATDLGYLLHKHPDRVQRFDVAYGQAHVYYTEATADRCTACLLLEVDAIGLVRGPRGERSLEQYVNDRPYVASSMLAVAMAHVFRSAMARSCKERPELVGTPMPITARLAAVPCKGGEPMLRDLFEPLGYQVEVQSHLLDDRFTSWGQSNIYTLTLRATKPLCDVLSHLYVLIPVMDNEKHYWVGDEEVAKLLRHGEGWLAAHPAREAITNRYLKYQRSLAAEVLRQLREQDGEGPDAIEQEQVEDPVEEGGERKLSLHQQRHGVIMAVLRARGANTVVDLGCGEGRLLRDLLKERSMQRLVGMDVSHRALEIAAERLKLDRLPPAVRSKIELVHGSLLYRDRRLEGLDAAVLCEVIEHLDAARLAAMERVVFGGTRPALVVVTTPNSEYNVMWEGVGAGAMRHKDHRFEWSRAEFAAWATRVAQAYGYTVETSGIGEPALDPQGKDVGTPTQMGVFSRAS